MKKLLKTAFASCMVLGLALSATACSQQRPQTDESGKTATGTYAYLAIDINPSVEIVVKDGVVESVTAANDDASILLSGEDFVGLSVQEVGNKIVSLAEQTGYLNENNKSVKITVSSDDEGYTATIESEAVAGAQSGSDFAEVNCEPRAADERALEKLKEENPELYKDLTPAKLRLIEAVLKYDPTMTYERGATMTTKELLELLEELEEDYRDLVCEGLKDSFKEKLKEVKLEAEREIAAVYGEEYLAAWERYTALEIAYETIEKKAEEAVLSEPDILLITELLGIADGSEIFADGKITPDRLDDYLDKLFDEKRGNEEEKEFFKQLERSVEAILDKYDEDNYVLTDEDNAALTAVWGEELAFKTLEEAEEFVEEQEESLEELRDSVVLTEEQKAQIKEIKDRFRDCKQAVREEMKEEVEAVKEELRKQKEERFNRFGNDGKDRR